ncbi:hypothetical protein J1G44_18385 [Cellulomonas sp. zg-ZUI199]|uniref:Uncharacterized protein n=1 Tax=Cellulomonas wangleii TaxID=2816956 RepID=A0ABX8D8Y2_9CELL|nr:MULTISPECIES: hypothetical protein [Cellulomonas]MBO0900480.1 hypothetical protein [Cellulomonas sp. zg-ZUI22]MBO0926445.1 hypothetical protein [Cellulomonas wangleii]QVI63885.1 hypothetical protein KG103_08730 [Cellulomonas wangleii]
MTDTILVLTEDTLAESDVRHIVGLHPDESPAYRVLVPADTDRPLIPWIIDALSLGELREAWERATGHEPSRTRARQTAAEQVAGSVAAFVAAGRDATGEITDDDPLPALRTAVAGGGVREVVVVTYPHMIEDTFHTDWASRAREELHVPVLHLYSGTSELG